MSDSDDDVPISVLLQKESIDDDIPLSQLILKDKSMSPLMAAGSPVPPKSVKVKKEKIKELDISIKNGPKNGAKVQGEKKIFIKENVKPEALAAYPIKREPGIKSETRQKRVKVEEMEDSQEPMDEYRWWLEEGSLDNTQKWVTLEHQGVCFPPPYIPHGVPMRYNGVEIVLPPEIEEITTFYAAIIGTPYEENPVFRRNFFADFRKVIQQHDQELYGKIQSLELCDFSLIAEYCNALKEKKKNRTKEEKELEKAEKQELIDRYGYCTMNGRREKVGNFRVEPPGLFRGRGDHPKTGSLKLRVTSEQITLNLGPDAPIPPAPEGHQWGTIVHLNTVTWLATWVENINGDSKYVFLAPGSRLKGISDMRKFEKARELKDCVDYIRQNNQLELTDDSLAVKQRATALWLIDNLALRAGNEKGDDEADTVGCCSLRLEHAKLAKPSTLIFDFLGKDSIRYYNEVLVPKIIYSNMKLFMNKPKGPADPVFDTLTTSSLNAYLNQLMPGLTAKVFRTFNASFTFQKCLAEQKIQDASVQEKLLAYNRANRQVAVLCNHQRAVPKSHKDSIQKLSEKIKLLKVERQLIRRELKNRVSDAAMASRNDDLASLWESDIDDEIEKQKIVDAAKMDDEKQQKCTDQGNSPARLKATLPTSRELGAWSNEKLEKKFSDLDNRIRALKIQRTDRDEGKETALGTSKINYIDPRISVVWTRSHQVPIDRIFNKSLQEKFKWAMDAEDNWSF